MMVFRYTLAALGVALGALLFCALWVATRIQRPPFRVVWVALLLTIAGCDVTVLAPEEEVCEEDPCELVVTIRVVRAGNTYWTNELDVQDNKLAFDCRRVLIEEEWVIIGGIAWLFSYETWDCYDCPDVPDMFNAAAAVYTNEWF